MTNFDKTDIEPLDFIISQLLFKQIVTADDLIKEGLIAKNNDKGFELDLAYSPIKEFVRYLHILDEYGACDCSFNEDAEFARVNRKTFQFQKQGGFKKIFSDFAVESELKKQKGNLELKNLELQNENLEYQQSLRKKEEHIRRLTRDNLRLENWDIRFRWYIAVITFVIGLILKHFIDN